MNYDPDQEDWGYDFDDRDSSDFDDDICLESHDDEYDAPELEYIPEICQICGNDEDRCTCVADKLSNENLEIIQELSSLPRNHAQLLCVLWRQNASFDCQYHTHVIPKKSGGKRTIEVPRPILKKLQRFLLESLERCALLHDSCHGFRKKHSIKSNALPHVGCEMVINFDIKDFFPSITRTKIKYMFRSLGHNDNAADFLTAVATRHGHLPQGAPTSPMIANILCFEMDNKLSSLAETHHANYTRYADDLTFSGKQSILRSLPAIKQIVKDEGFELNPSKFRIQRKGKRQEVTGLIVNDKVSVPRNRRKKLRAAIHRVASGKIPFWNDVHMSEQVMQGHIDFITAIHPDLLSYYRQLEMATGYVDTTKKPGCPQ